MWATRRWRRLLNLIDRLPVSSRFVEAQANDEEFARAAVEMHDGGDDEPEGPRLSEWDPTRAELAVIADRLGEVVAVLIAANGGTAVQIPPRPRPVTAFDRARGDSRKHRHLALVTRLLPPEGREEA